MSLAEQLLAQATRLAARDSPETEQADARRSISAAYYSVFHLLTDAAATMLIAGPGRENLRAYLRRAFVHADMLDVAKAFAAGNLGPRYPHGSWQLSSSIKKIAAAFRDLQDARHRADYDVSIDITEEEVVLAITFATTAHALWYQERNTEAAQLFLVAMLVHRQRRG